MEPFLGEIRLFSIGFAPRGWAACEGQMMPVSTNTALFSLLGVQFGGNGTTTFGLPDLRGRVPVNPPKLRHFSNFSDSWPCAVFGLEFVVLRDFRDGGRSGR
ncbi:phage tail protein, partial [Janthinobacterium sp. HLX7-2]|uniref:phage tail protein n=1 Tax=Janthinobacterium sp. HLX7-2 TaxID=1259331 RepID=UPI003F211332